jgi:CheY-like chemotaxis protein
MPQLRCGVRPDMSDPDSQEHLRSQLREAGVEEGDGVLVTESVQKALAHPGPKVVLVRPSQTQAARVFLAGDRVEVLAAPCGMRALFLALERVTRPSATVFVAVSGRILREVVRGMLEREGFSVVAPEGTGEAAELFASCRSDLVVRDLDDPVWDRFAFGDLPVVCLGDARDVWSGPLVAKPVRAEELLASVLARLAPKRERRVDRYGRFE